MHRMIAMGSLLLAVSFATLAAPVYKWVDAEGQTHFGSLPPEGVQAELVSTSVHSAKPPLEPARTEVPENGDESQQAIDAKVKKDVAAQQEELRKYCAELRSNLALLENNPRLQTEEKGEVRRVGEDERQEQIKQTRKALQENCQ
jgi:hypothetical protein